MTTDVCRNCKCKTILIGVLAELRTGSWIAVDKKQCYEVVGKISSVLLAHQRMFLASSLQEQVMIKWRSESSRLLLHLLSFTGGVKGGWFDRFWHLL